jgi:hypothetical protein
MRFNSGLKGLNEYSIPQRRKYNSKSSRKCRIFCFLVSVNFGKHRLLETSFRHCEVPCPATVPLISLLQTLHALYCEGKTSTLST